MTTASFPGNSPWLEYPLSRHSRLAGDLAVDVAVVGTGLTGVTAAWLLAREGVRVALLERARIAAADTGHTTAHLTLVTDRSLVELAAAFGPDRARAFWAAGARAIDEIERIVVTRDIECGFARVPGYRHAPVSSPAQADGAMLEKEAALAVELGIAARYHERLPYGDAPGIEFPGQARFHPHRYLTRLLADIVAAGGAIFEHSEVDLIERDPLQVHANGHCVACDYVIVATHRALMGQHTAISVAPFDRTLSLVTSYVVGAPAASLALPDGLYWDTGDPYEYLRIDREGPGGYVMLGGEDVPAARATDAAAAWQALAGRLEQRFPGATIRHRWKGQLVLTEDGLPFIGEFGRRVFVATGFCGNGFTLGTLSALMARDRFLQRDNPWCDLFSPARPTVNRLSGTEPLPEQ